MSRSRSGSQSASGSTPIISTRSSSSVSTRPRTRRSPPNAPCQKSWVRIPTPRPPTAVSAARNPRPMAGATPRRSKKFAVTRALRRLWGSPAFVRVDLKGRAAATPAQTSRHAAHASSARRLAGNAGNRSCISRTWIWTVTSCPGSRNGSGASSTPWTREKTAVDAPMPSPSTATTTAVNPGLRRSPRATWRKSRTRPSSQRHPQTARVSSRMRARFPSLRRAARAAASGATPMSTSRSRSSSTWRRISCSRSSPARRRPR